MTLKDYILTYERDGKIVANIFDYYLDYIKPLSPRFQNYNFGDSHTVICWFKDHQDTDPSMGYIKDRYHKGGHLYHCFGCGRTGDVIRLNQIIMSQYYDKELTEKESCLDLAEKFGIPLEDFDELTDEDYEVRFERNLKKIDKLQKRYTEDEFHRNLLNIRKTGVDLNKVNDECVKMIATAKLLYD